MKKFFSYLKRPPAGFVVFAVLAAAACIAGAIACAACGYTGWYVYALYAAAVTVMVAVGRPAPVSEVLAIASAAYTFYKVISAAVGFFKVRRLHDPLLQAFRNINLADAAVSLLSLQVTLVAVFSQGEGESMKPLNAAMGFFVCLLTIALGAWMIAEAGARLRTLKEEGETEKEEKENRG